jgi:hypothetical protein
MRSREYNMEHNVADELQEQITGLGEKYWEGKENFFIRYFTYMERGLGVFNQFKYYIALPFATYYTFEFMKAYGSLFWIPLMIIGGLPILIIVGRYQLQKMNKTTDYVNTITGSIFQYKPMQMSIEQVKYLKEIRDELRNKHANI